MHHKLVRRLQVEPLESRRVLATYIVDSLGDWANGTCGIDGVGNDDCSLRSAIIAANNNPGPDEIRMPAGLYRLEIGNDIAFDETEGSLDITDSVSIVGISGNAADVIIDAERLDSVFTVGELGPIRNPITARLESLTIQGGRSDVGGGGVRSSGASLEIINSVLRDNVGTDSARGGGVSFAGNAAADTLLIRDTTFVENSAGDLGGGLFVVGLLESPVTLENVLFEENFATFSGGGAYIDAVGAVNLSDTQFRSNISDEAGGGLYLLNTGPVLISRSTFDGNIANGGGGGGLALLTDALIEDSLFQNNRVTADAFAFDEGGGGIAIAEDDGVQPTVGIQRSEIRGNVAPLGGGIGAANANLTISDSMIAENEATNSFGGGGGIGIAQETVPGSAPRTLLTLTGSILDGNRSAADAGGLGVVDADTDLRNTRFVNNVAAGRGGGIGIISLLGAARLRMEASTIAFNTAGDNGGGVAAVEAPIALVNVTVSDNVAGGAGGGIAFSISDVDLQGVVGFSTIASNTAALPGANVASTGLQLAFHSSVIADPLGAGGQAVNFAGAPSGRISLGWNLDSDGSAGFSQTGDLSNVNPRLGPLADNGGPVLTRALLPMSPAIDAGDTLSLPTDARGFPRPIDGDGDGVARNDIGAFEAEQLILPPVLTGHIYCDANGNGSEDSGEAVVEALVFIDRNGNRTFDLGEPTTSTNSAGDYMFREGSVADGPANVVVAAPAGCFPSGTVGVTRAALTTGSLTRDVATITNPATGLDDLVVVNELGGDLIRLVNNGSGQFSVGPALPLGDRPYAVSVYQDAAGAATIAVAAVGGETDPGKLFVIENGTFEQYAAGDGPIAVVADDFNGDGAADFVTAGFRDGKIWLRLGGEAELREIATASVPRSLWASDLNGDGYRDLVVVSAGFQAANDSEVVALLGDGQGGFQPLRETVSRSGAIDVVAADYDGLPGDELVVANFSGGVDIYEVDTLAGALRLVHSIDSPPGISSVVAEDLNGDGWLDVVTANPSLETIEIFIGQADRSFVSNGSIQSVATPAALAIGRFDNNPIRDLAVTNLFATSTPYRLPSTVTILGLTVAEREVTIAAGQVATADFEFARFMPNSPQPLPPSNFQHDVNGDDQITPLDALLVLNEIARRRNIESEREPALQQRYQTDVNRDGQSTPLDALLILNRIARDRRSDWAGVPPSDAADEQERHSAVDLIMAQPAMLF